MDSEITTNQHEGTGETDVVRKIVVITDLGPDNVGIFGPSGQTNEVCEAYAQAAASPEYSRRPQGWRCVDGRPSGDDLQAIEQGLDAETAASQIAGSLPVSETAAGYMDDPSKHLPHSEMLAEDTFNAIQDGEEILVHGDESLGKAGCKANADTRSALRFNAANADIVIPKVWSIVQLMGLDKHIEEDDLMKSVLNGKKAADNDELWNVTPEGAVDVMVANGAQYEELVGAHHEHAERIDLTDEAFDKAAFIRDQSTAEGQVQAFAASFGGYAKMAFRRAQMHGETERSAALKISRVMLFNTGLSKMLLNEDARVGVVTVAEQ